MITKAAKEGTFKIKPGRGRKTKLSDSFIKQEMEKPDDKDMTNRQLSEHFGVCARYIRKRLNRLGLRRHVKVTVPGLTNKAKTARQEFAFDRESWTQEDWHHVIWTDECKILFQKSRKQYVRRPAGEQYAFQLSNLARSFPNDRRSLMIWGCFKHGRRGPLRIFDDEMLGNKGKKQGEKRNGLTSRIYTDEILEKVLLPFYEETAREEGYVSQVVEDNAPPHKGPATRDWRYRHDMDTMPWPASSPDLNAIENVWDAKGQG